MAQFDLIVIGSGPGGYVAAIRAAQLGLQTALVEKDAGLGGTCLWRGCIPAKTWLESAHRFEQMASLKEFGIDNVDVSKMKADLSAIVTRKGKIVSKNAKGIEFLMKKNKVTVLKGYGKLMGSGKVEVKGETTEIHTARKIILATGSVPRELPGLETDGQHILNSDHILDLTSLPKHLVILGGGAIGVEFASTFARLGSKVTLVELADRLLPIEDEAIGIELAKILTRSYKIECKIKTKIASIEKNKDHLICQLSGECNDRIEASHVLIAAGRTPVTSKIGIESTRAKTDKGYVQVNEFMLTAEEGLYAIGDIVNTPWLAHVASDEGIVAAEHAAQSLGKPVVPHPINYARVPSCTYCDPEVSSIGLTEQKAKDQGYSVTVGQFPFMPMAKANILGEAHGFIKIVSEATYGEILGIHIIGPKATELIASSVALLGGEFTVQALINTMYPHPTLNEVFPEAARAVRKQSINM
ncbi:MAG: dihydrolipoyl dehydrogenase [Holophagaceae bacterium]|jgi:dihydrolipoamide dehydrogenase